MLVIMINDIYLRFVFMSDEREMKTKNHAFALVRILCWKQLIERLLRIYLN